VLATCSVAARTPSSRSSIRTPTSSTTTSPPRRRWARRSWRSSRHTCKQTTSPAYRRSSHARARPLPELAFVSKSIQRNRDELAIEGDITIKGHSEPVDLTATITEPIDDPYGGTRFGLKLEATIDRRAFGVNWNNPLPSGEPALSNDVVLSADLQLTRQA
jgi:hypothetical protein